MYLGPAMETPKRRAANRTGFKEFLREQRKLHSAGGSPQFEIRLPSLHEHTHVKSESSNDEPLVSLQCGEGPETEVLEKVPLNALVGCSRWFYELFMSRRMSEWSDRQSGVICLPSLPPAVAKSVVDFAIMERRVNPMSSFLVTPPDLDNWELTKDLLGRNRTIFQFPVYPDMAMDLCHAALFLEIPALVDITCRMLGYFVEFLPQVDEIDTRLVHKILSHVEPLKLALMERLPQYASYVEQLTPVWQSHCEARGLDVAQLDVAFSWYRYDRLGDLPLSTADVSPREVYIHDALQRELGALATHHKVSVQMARLSTSPTKLHSASSKKVNNASSSSSSRPTSSPSSSSGTSSPTEISSGKVISWILDTDGVWKRSATLQEQHEIREDTETSACTVELVENPDGTKNAKALLDLAELESHVHTVTLSCPIDFSIIELLKHLITLEIRDTSLWQRLPTALQALPALRHLKLDSIHLSGPNDLAQHIYQVLDSNRTEFDVPPGWTPWKEGADKGLLDPPLLPQHDQTSLYSMIMLFQTCATLPSLETFQFSNIELHGIMAESVWNFVIAPHWKRRNSVFFPSLRRLSLFGSGLTSRALSTILYNFQNSPLETFDIGTNYTLLTAPEIDWSYISSWTHLKHFIANHNSMSTPRIQEDEEVAEPTTPQLIGSKMPPSLECISIEGVGYGNVEEFFRGLATPTALKLRAVYLPTQCSGGFFRTLATYSSRLCPSLEIVDASCTPFNNSCIDLLVSFIRSAPKLKELRLCPSRFTADGLYRITLLMSEEEFKNCSIVWNTRNMERS